MFAALAVSPWIEHQTGWSIGKFFKTARRYRRSKIRASPHTITATDPLPADLRQASTQSTARHQLTCAPAWPKSGSKEITSRTTRFPRGRAVSILIAVSNPGQAGPDEIF